MNCEECTYYTYDEDDEAYYCTVSMDEDDYARLMQTDTRGCPYYSRDDEYEIVRHQM